ncbi:MAG TPA: porin [Bacillota bacterium]|nr:porin [Bacillota bacterium]
MKKFLGIALTVGLVLSMTVVTVAAPKVTVGGEGNYGYDFAKDSYKGDEGANFGDLALTVTAEINNNVSLFGKLKTEDLSKGMGEHFTDEAWAYLKFAPMNLKIGYFGFGFGGSKDILDVPMGDFKSSVGLQAETLIAEAVAAKLYFPTRSSTKDDVIDGTVCADNAFGLRFDYNKEAFGVGVIYGRTDVNDVINGDTVIGDNATAYTLTAYYKPLKDLKTFLDYSIKEIEYRDSSSTDDTSIIIGVLYTPANLPYECRLEYDLDDENDFKSPEENFNPWGIRLAYKLNPNTKVEINCNEKAFGSKERSIKLNLTF